MNELKILRVRKTRDGDLVRVSDLIEVIEISERDGLTLNEFKHELVLKLAKMK